MMFFSGLPVNHAMPAPPEITEWPAECEGRTYCATMPANYPTELFEALLEGVVLDIEQNAGLENRSSDANVEDVASCRPIKSMKHLYLIKDNNENIRMVAQTKTFQIKVQVEECRHPGRTLFTENLNARLLRKNRVDCFETKVPMQFLVLSLDGTMLESVAPKDGIPTSCAGKLMTGKA
ncbi:uncharacterized protein isoform X2 [Choristoneura fumiferana]